MRHFRFLLAVTILLTACTAPTSGTATTPSALRKLRLPMGYIANVQYAPFYVAVQKGFFKAHGIELEFDYSFETDGVKLVATNELPFAVVSGEQVVLARSQDLPVVYVMQWYRRFPIAVIAKRSAGINTPADLKGKRIGLPGYFGASFVGWRALLQSAGLTPEDVTEQDLGGFVQVQALTEDRVDAVVGYVNNEPIQLELMGEDITVLDVGEYVNLVPNGLLTNETRIAQDHALVADMVAATMEGLRYTLEHPDEAFDITATFVPDLKKDAETTTRNRRVLDASLELWRAETLGPSDAAAWTTTQDVLVTLGQVHTPGDVTRFFDNSFVK